MLIYFDTDTEKEGSAVDDSREIAQKQSDSFWPSQMSSKMEGRSEKAGWKIHVWCKDNNEDGMMTHYYY